MYSSAKAVNYLLRQEEFTGQITTQVKRENIPHTVSNHETTAVMGGSLIAFIVFWGGFFFIVSKTNRLAANHTINTLKMMKQKVPCSNCQFASNNHYLKCAVQPSLAFTQEATQCPDFCSSKK